MPPLAGPDVSIDDSRTLYIEYQARATDDTGGTRASYSGDAQQKAKLESGLDNFGAHLAIYDPVISQLLAGEL